MGKGGRVKRSEERRVGGVAKRGRRGKRGRVNGWEKGKGEKVKGW